MVRLAMILKSSIEHFLILLLIFCCVGASKFTRFFNVRDYGAVPDGKTDSTKALELAWKDACECKNQAGIVIRGSYLAGPLTFKGPCKGFISIKFRGNLSAWTNPRVYTRDWIEFQNVNGLSVIGSGKFDGQGAKSWQFNGCSKDPHCKPLPMTLVFRNVSNAKVRGITSINSKFFHIKVVNSNNVSFRMINITAPAESPNTDGIHIGDSDKIIIAKSFIATGDDCISVGPGCSNIKIHGVYCGPGHGISIGSLGKDPHEGNVTDVVVTNCTLSGTDNGLRIKSWQSSPKNTIASNIIFDDVVMNNVRNPIIIDQKYCPNGLCRFRVKYPSKVKISNIKYRNVRGTSASPISVKLHCNEAMPCERVILSDIRLKHRGMPARNGSCSFVNVRGRSNGNAIMY